MRTRTYRTTYADLVALTPFRSTWIWAGVGALYGGAPPVLLGAAGLATLAADPGVALGSAGGVRGGGGPGAGQLVGEVKMGGGLGGGRG